MLIGSVSIIILDKAFGHKKTQKFFQKILASLLSKCYNELKKSEGWAIQKGRNTDGPRTDVGKDP